MNGIGENKSWMFLKKKISTSAKVIKTHARVTALVAIGL